MFSTYTKIKNDLRVLKMVDLNYLVGIFIYARYTYIILLQYHS